MVEAWGGVALEMMAAIAQPAAAIVVALVEGRAAPIAVENRAMVAVVLGVMAGHRGGAGWGRTEIAAVLETSREQAGAAPAAPIVTRRFKAGLLNARASRL